MRRFNADPNQPLHNTEKLNPIPSGLIGLVCLVTQR